MTIIEPAGALREATGGRVRLEPCADGPRLVGWAPEDPSMPGQAPEIAVQCGGLGTRCFGTDPKIEHEALPAGAHPFAWPLPAALCDGTSRTLQVWCIATGQELAGSPIVLGSGGAMVAPSGPMLSLSRWDAPLAGHVGAGDAVELATGVWVTAEPPARSLRYELTIAEADATGAPPERGIRVLADAISGRIALHFPLMPILAGAGHAGPMPVQLPAWLPQATQRAMQAQAELWLLRLRDGAFEKLRRLRRVRIFRHASLLTAQLTHGAEDGDAGALWLSIEALHAKGIAARPPRLARTVEPIPEGMEDGRLQDAFAALGDMVRVHGQAAMEHHALLPELPARRHTIPAALSGDAHPFTQVILPVYNGDEVVRGCLRSLQSAGTGPFEVVVVDDGSRGFTAEMLRQQVHGDARFTLHRRDTNRGYTKSINEGVALTQAPWVVVLNSDTIVPRGWLDRLHAAARARPGTGMVGPLSNAATWQSIPEVKRPDGSWSVNPMIEPEHLEAVQRLLSEASTREYPEFPVLNGFCTLIARAVFDCVGAYDEDAFPMG